MREPPRILLAENDKEMRTLVALALRKAGYKVVECSNGINLLDQLSEVSCSNKHENFNLIISDIRMPGFSGMEILESFHACDDFPPLILITAFGDEETHAKAERLGAAAMLDKPFDIDILVGKVREIISLPDYRP